MKIFIAVLLLFLFVSVQFSQDKSDKPLKNEIRTVKPSEFKFSDTCPKMPSNIVDYLEENKCLIPQSSIVKKDHNAFQIQFGRRGQKDWAVLCSKDGYSSIWIFWNSSTTNVSQFAKYSDNAFGNGNSFFRAIGKDTTKPLTEQNVRQYGEIIPFINTWGIDEQTPEGNFVIYYIYQKQLVVLQSDLDFNINTPFNIVNEI